MAICGFCGNIVQEDLSYCERCGHSFTLWRQNYHRGIMNPGLWIHFPQHDQEEQKDFFVECSGALYSFWDVLYNSYQSEEVTYTLTWEKLSLFADPETPYSLATQFPSYIPATIELFLMVPCEREYPEMGIRAWEMELMRRGDIWIGEMSQPQRAKFLKWFLTTPPHASENGDLHFAL